MVEQEIAVTAWAKNGFWCIRGRNVFSGVFTAGALYGDWGASNFIGSDLILDGVSVRFYDAGAAGGSTVTVRVYPDTGQYIDLVKFTTTATDDVRVVTAVGLPMVKRPRVTGSQYFANIDLEPDSGLGDLLEIAMWGRYLMPATPEAGPSPVSVEGYKWPLTRR